MTRAVSIAVARATRWLCSPAARTAQCALRNTAAVDVAVASWHGSPRLSSLIRRPVSPLPSGGELAFRIMGGTAMKRAWGTVLVSALVVALVFRTLVGQCMSAA